MTHDSRLKTQDSQPNSCPECGASVTKHEGCVSCESCGWSACSS